MIAAIVTLHGSPGPAGGATVRLVRLAHLPRAMTHDFPARVIVLMRNIAGAFS